MSRYKKSTKPFVKLLISALIGNFSMAMVEYYPRMTGTLTFSVQLLGLWTFICASLLFYYKHSEKLYNDMRTG